MSQREKRQERDENWGFKVTILCHFPVAPTEALREDFAFVGALAGLWPAGSGSVWPGASDRVHVSEVIERRVSQGPGAPASSGSGEGGRHGCWWWLFASPLSSPSARDFVRLPPGSGVNFPALYWGLHHLFALARGWGQMRGKRDLKWAWVINLLLLCRCQGEHALSGLRDTRTDRAQPAVISLAPRNPDRISQSPPSLHTREWGWRGCKLRQDSMLPSGGGIPLL